MLNGILVVTFLQVQIIMKSPRYLKGGSKMEFNFGGQGGSFGFDDILKGFGFGGGG
jgi:hypothetical protein